MTAFLTSRRYRDAGGLFRNSNRGGWYDSSQIDDLKQNIAGTTAVTAAADVVGFWRDRTHNGNHLIASADDTTRPTYRTSPAGVLFDATNDQLRAATLTQTLNGTALSIIIAFRTAGGAGNFGRLFSASLNLSTNDHDSDLRCCAYFNGSAIAMRRTTDLATVGININLNYLFEFYFDGQAGEFWDKGVLSARVNKGGQFTIGAFSINKECNAASFLSGYFKEVVVIDRILQGWEREALRTDWRNKWTLY